MTPKVREVAAPRVVVKRVMGGSWGAVFSVFSLVC